MGEKHFGHMTRDDGTHTPLTQEQANALWEGAKRAIAERKTRYPDSATAIKTLFDARQALIDDHGWKEGQYCPKDGSFFAVITPGSTGIFSGYYLGEWPDGDVLVGDELTHPKAIFFKPIDKLTDAERATLEKCEASERAYIDRLGCSFGDGNPDD